MSAVLKFTKTPKAAKASKSAAPKVVAKVVQAAAEDFKIADISLAA